MKKLTLDLDHLLIESFEPSSDSRSERGTVRAHDYSDDLDCWRLPDPRWDSIQGGSCYGTCGYSCDTCNYSCGGTCGEGTCYGDTCVCWP